MTLKLPRFLASRWPPQLYVAGFAVLLLAPLFFTALIARRGASESEARVADERLERAKLTALTVSSFMDAQFATLRALAFSPDIRDLGNRPDLRSVLERVLADTPDWESIEVFQADGETIVGVGPAVPLTNVADRPYFQEVFITNQPAIGPAAPGRRTLFPAVPLVVPVDFVNGARGAVMAWVSTARLEHALVSTGEEGSVHVSLLDSQGTVFARSGPDAALSRPQAGDTATVGATLAGETGVRRMQASDGVEMLVAYAPVSRAPWSVLVSQSTAAAFDSIRDRLEGQLLLLGFAAVAIGLLALTLGVRLTRSYSRQIEAMDRADQFIASASHDLKTPLTAIKTLAQLLQRRLARAEIVDAAWFGEGLAEIDAATTKMTRQINELLDTSRIQRETMLDLNRRSTDLVALTRRVAQDQQQTTDRHAIRIEAPVNRLTGRWDSERLERVIANLLGNAIKYSPDGGIVMVTIAREHTPAPVNGAPPNGDVQDWAVLSVRDEGLGIPAADLSRIFDQFHRASNVAGRVSGAGIGLAGAKQIVEQHGGYITVESKEGRGSTFTVGLPVT
ncbi:MAG: sensor histidine kinase [Dehalococcoidia bacterium]